MEQQRADLRLADEHRLEVAALRQPRQDALQHELALEPLGPGHHGPVDLRHAALADPAEQAVAPDAADGSAPACGPAGRVAGRRSAVADPLCPDVGRAPARGGCALAFGRLATLSGTGRFRGDVGFMGWRASDVYEILLRGGACLRRYAGFQSAAHSASRRAAGRLAQRAAVDPGGDGPQLVLRQRLPRGLAAGRKPRRSGRPSGSPAAACAADSCAPNRPLRPAGARLSCREGTATSCVPGLRRAQRQARRPGRQAASPRRAPACRGGSRRPLQWAPKIAWTCESNVAGGCRDRRQAPSPVRTRSPRCPRAAGQR